MDKSKIFGLWQEHCGGNFPPLKKEPQRILSLTDAEKIARYLDNCPIWIASPGLVNSCIGNMDEIAGTLSIKTNGKWAWQDTMPYYVRHFRISPPLEFLHEIKNGDAAIPLENEINVMSLDFPDF